MSDLFDINDNNFFRKKKTKIFYLDLFVGIIIVTRDIIEKSCIPFALGSIGCRLISFIQVCIFLKSRMLREKEKRSEINLIFAFISREQLDIIPG